MSEAGERRERRERIAQVVAPALRGLEYAYVFPNKAQAVAAILTLVQCRPHGGIHHFAVVSEGLGVAFSESGRECLLAAGLL